MAEARRDSTRLGVLKEIEGLTERKVCETFDLIFGASTGAIIASLLGLGKSVDEVESLYRTHVVKVMERWFPSRKSAALESLATEVFGELKFDPVMRNGSPARRWSPLPRATTRRPALPRSDSAPRRVTSSELEPAGRQTSHYLRTRIPRARRHGRRNCRSRSLQEEKPRRKLLFNFARV
jgi:patatin-like phospholipase